MHIQTFLLSKNDFKINWKVLFVPFNMLWYLDIKLRHKVVLLMRSFMRLSFRSAVLLPKCWYCTSVAVVASRQQIWLINHRCCSSDLIPSCVFLTWTGDERVSGGKTRFVSPHVKPETRWGSCSSGGRAAYRSLPSQESQIQMPKGWWVKSKPCFASGANIAAVHVQ